MVRVSLGVSLGPVRISTGGRRRRRRPPARRRPSSTRRKPSRGSANRGSTRAHSTGQSNGGDLTALLGLCLLVALVGLAVVLVMVAVAALAVGLVIWGIVALVKYARRRRTATSEASRPGDRDEALFTHDEALRTFNPQLRTAFVPEPVAGAMDAPLVPLPSVGPTASVGGSSSRAVVERSMASAMRERQARLRQTQPPFSAAQPIRATASSPPPSIEPSRTFAEVQVGDVTWMGEVLGIETKDGKVWLELGFARMGGRPEQLVTLKD